MIINVRGTHGSGKSTLVRKLMKLYGHREPIFLKGRRQPIGYVCSPHADRDRGAESLFVLGHYESPTGGCDTIPKTDLMFKQIHKWHAKGFHVIYEGILAQHSTSGIISLHALDDDVRVIVLDIPLKKAIRSVKKRRRARGNTRPFNPQNVVKEARSVSNAAQRLKDQGLRVTTFHSRKRALRRVCSLLGVSDAEET